MTSSPHGADMSHDIDGERRPLALRRLAALAIVPMLLAACAGPERAATAPASHVPVPGRGASPQAIVEAYLAASSAHDVDTMNALLASSARHASQSRPTQVFSHVRTFPPGPDGADGAAWPKWHHVVRVDVSALIVKDPDPEIPSDINASWGFILGRQSNTDPWLILDPG